MKLPIATFTNADVVRTARRCRMELSRVVAEEFSADGLFAFASPDLPTLPEANCVEAERPLAVGQLGRVEAEFAASGARCRRWTVPAEDTMLVERGARVRTLHVMRLIRWQHGAAIDDMVLQCRAAPGKTEGMLRRRFGDDSAALQARLLGVENPQDEWLIALRDGEPIASAALLISGEAGMLHDLYALTDGGAAVRHLIDRLIEYCGRAGLRHVVACAKDDEVALLRSAGFTEVGTIVEHDMPADKQGG